MAKLLQVDGSVLEVFPVNGTDFRLAEVQAMAGGLVEVLDIGWLIRHGLEPMSAVAGSKKITLESDDIMIVNEEGLLIGMEPNTVASVLADRKLVGPVLLCKNNEFR